MELLFDRNRTSFNESEDVTDGVSQRSKFLEVTLVLKIPGCNWPEKQKQEASSIP